MKTINLNRLITLLCVTGLLLSCSNDDDITSVDPTPRNFNAPSGNEAVPIDLNFTVNLDGQSEGQGCEPGSYLFQHSGSGTNDVLGNYTVDISYCGQPQSVTVSSIEVVLEDDGGNKIYLNQRPNSSSGGDQDNFGNNVSGGTPGIYTGNGGVNHDDELLVFEVSGGTGIYSSAEGTLTSKLSPGFQAGAEMSNFLISGLISGI